MIFSELYGAYYNAVAQILQSPLAHPISKEEMRNIIENAAFSESILSIEPALVNESWQLLRSNGKTVLEHNPSMPLTVLQKRWLKAISLDPRIKLFDFDDSWLCDVSPLFTPKDIYIFDRYADGDPFEDDEYIKTFRSILDALRNRHPLSVDVKNRSGLKLRLSIMPQYLEYSEKDDKFRLITSGYRCGRTINLGRILSCEPFYGEIRSQRQEPPVAAEQNFIIELVDERNALERAMLHFANFEKEAIRLDNKHYRIKINYNKDDETEMVIRVLSFGPFIKVCEPKSFVNLIKERLEMQKSCEL